MKARVEYKATSECSGTLTIDLNSGRIVAEHDDAPQELTVISNTTTLDGREAMCLVNSDIIEGTGTHAGVLKREEFGYEWADKPRPTWDRPVAAKHVDSYLNR